jgi:hypothetical protein
MRSRREVVGTRVHYCDGIATYVGPEAGPLFARVGAKRRGIASANQRAATVNRFRVAVRFSTWKAPRAAGHRGRPNVRRDLRVRHVRTLFGWEPGDHVADQWHSLPARIWKARNRRR